MLCNTYKPVPELTQYIKSYILVEDHSEVMKGTWMTIFPSGHLEMIFSYGDDVHFSNGYYLRHGHGYLSGQILEPAYYRCSGSLKVISIIFKPWGICRFLNIPQNELINSPIDLELLLKNNNNITQRIADEQRHERKVAILNDHFSSLLSEINTNPGPVSESAGMIMNCGGNIAITDICGHLNHNIKTMERNFKNIIGLTPKAFSKIIRFNNAFNDIKSGNYRDIHDIIHRHGFYDQSHFINEFRKYTGLPPSSFLEAPNDVNHSLREIVSI
jgi:AraC-like DNA-binding protein